MRKKTVVPIYRKQTKWETQTHKPCRVYITCGGWNPIDKKKPRSHSIPNRFETSHLITLKEPNGFNFKRVFFLFRSASKDHIEFVGMIEHWDRWTLHNIIDVMHIHHVKLMSIVSLWIFKNEFDQNANVSGSNVRVHNELVIWGDHWYSRQCSTNILETPSKCTQTHTHDRWWAATWNVDCKMNAARTQIFTQWYKMSKFDSPM